MERPWVMAGHDGAIWWCCPRAWAIDKSVHVLRMLEADEPANCLLVQTISSAAIHNFDTGSHERTDLPAHRGTLTTRPSGVGLAQERRGKHEHMLSTTTCRLRRAAAPPHKNITTCRKTTSISPDTVMNKRSTSPGFSPVDIRPALPFARLALFTRESSPRELPSLPSLPRVPRLPVDDPLVSSSCANRASSLSSRRTFRRMRGPLLYQALASQRAIRTASISRFLSSISRNLWPKRGHDTAGRVGEYAGQGYENAMYLPPGILYGW